MWVYFFTYRNIFVKMNFINLVPAISLFKKCLRI